MTNDHEAPRAPWSVALGLAAGVFVISAFVSFSWFGVCENAEGTSRESLCTVESDGFHFAVATVPPLAILAVALFGGTRRLLVSLATMLTLFGAGLLGIAAIA